MSWASKSLFCSSCPEILQNSPVRYSSVKAEDQGWNSFCSQEPNLWDILRLCSVKEALHLLVNYWSPVENNMYSTWCNICMLERERLAREPNCNLNPGLGDLYLHGEIWRWRRFFSHFYDTTYDNETCNIENKMCFVCIRGNCFPTCTSVEFKVIFSIKNITCEGVHLAVISIWSFPLIEKTQVWRD